MKQLFASFRRPGVLLGTIAIAAGITGSAVALPGEDSVNSGDIVDNSVRGVDIDEDTLGNVPSAEKLDGKNASELDTRWALINESGDIERQTGGFTLVDCYSTNANCYIDIGQDARRRGLSAEISVANTDGSSILSGETGTAACGATTVACAPPNTEANDVVVVAPRNSAGAVPGGVTPPAAGDAARFYVFVTGSKGPEEAPLAE